MFGEVWGFKWKKENVSDNVLLFFIIFFLVGEGGEGGGGWAVARDSKNINMKKTEMGLVIVGHNIILK